MAVETQHARRPTRGQLLCWLLIAAALPTIYRVYLPDSPRMAVGLVIAMLAFVQIGAAVEIRERRPPSTWLPPARLIGR